MCPRISGVSWHGPNSLSVPVKSYLEAKAGFLEPVSYSHSFPIQLRQTKLRSIYETTPGIAST
jgi:hypothetical protein